MHRPNETVAALVATLAKARVELVNLEKSLTTFLNSAVVCEGEQTFHNALSPSDPDLEAPRRIDKSVLAIGAPRRYRNKEHLRFVAQQPCLVCGKKPADPHHLRFMQPRAIGAKVSDEFAVPLCRTHHGAVHRVGDERAWWKAARINPIKTARQLWSRTRLSAGATHLRPSSKPIAETNGARR
jgi:hypothetical protein